MKFNSESSVRLSFKLFRKISLWLAKQNVIGLADFSQEIYRENGNVFVFRVSDRKPSVSFFGENTVVFTDESGFEFRTFSSYKNFVTLAITVSKKWPDLKNKISKVVQEKRSVADEEMKALDFSKIANIQKVLNNPELWN
jgi:hypothetical protein